MMEKSRVNELLQLTSTPHTALVLWATPLTWKVHLEIKDTVNLCRYSLRYSFHYPHPFECCCLVNMSQSLMFVLPYLFFPSLKMSSVLLLLVSSATPKRVDVTCQVHRWAQLISHSNLSKTNQKNQMDPAQQFFLLVCVAYFHLAFSVNRIRFEYGLGDIAKQTSLVIMFDL